MDAIEALNTRRSVREFTAEPVSKDQLDILLHAAMQAPSACNQQPWHFMVVDSRDQLLALAAVHPYAQMLLHAPLAVVVCADLTSSTVQPLPKTCCWPRMRWGWARSGWASTRWRRG
jgi:nitroreductase